jgi:hypothetical protein
VPKLCSVVVPKETLDSQVSSKVTYKDCVSDTA